MFSHLVCNRSDDQTDHLFVEIRSDFGDVRIIVYRSKTSSMLSGVNDVTAGFLQ